MADNSIQKSHKSNDKPKYNNVIHKTTSESLRLAELDKSVTHPTAPQAPYNPRKISSFQITSVTVGSRVSTDPGEDSADDLDESHTDEISRVTDFENETPSFSEDTFSKDDVFYNASSATLGCAPVIPTSSQYGLAIVNQEGNLQPCNATVNSGTETHDMHVSVTNSGAGSIINFIGNSKAQEDMKDMQEHVRNERFKVVKIESTEPFRRGRWTCMDYLDHSNPQPNTTTITNTNLDDGVNLQAPDSGVVMNDNASDELVNSLDILKQSGQIGASLQTDPNIQKAYAMASPGQSLTQPINLVPQNVSVQSPPLEIPQQINPQTMQGSQQVPQQHPQSMTHINIPNQQTSHQQPSQQNVQQIPQSFPQHQLQQVIAQAQGIPQMQAMPMHQQLPQTMQHIPNQAQLQQMTAQHLAQGQPSLTNIGQMPQKLGSIQNMPTQPQLQQVNNQQSQLQQLQMQQMQGQAAQSQMHQLQQQQLGLNQQVQLQQMQALQSQQIPNHLQQMQMSGQLNASQQIPQMQAQLHQMNPNQPSNQQQVVTNIHPQLQQANLQSQYNPNQQSNAQAMMNSSIQSSQQTMVPTSHTVNVNYHPQQQQQMGQQAQTLPQEVLSNIVTSQGNSVNTNLQNMSSQPQGSTLPTNVQGMNTQQQGLIHQMSQQAQSMPQNTLQMMTQQQQPMTLALDNNQSNMQIPVSDAIYLQQANVNAQHQSLPQAQAMLQQQVNSANQNQQHIAQQNQLNMQYVLTQQQNLQNQGNVPNQSVPQGTLQHQQPNMQQMNQQMSQVSMPSQQSAQPMMQNMVPQVPHTQNIQMPIQQNIPAAMQGPNVHNVNSGVIQSQPNVQGNIQNQANITIASYPSQGLQQNILPVMSQTNMNNSAPMQNQPIEVNQSVATSQSMMSGTNSPVVSLPSLYQGGQTMVAEGQNFVSAGNIVNNMVNSNEMPSVQDSGQLDCTVIPDTNEGKEDGHQQNIAAEDESISGLAMALGGNNGVGSLSSCSSATVVLAAAVAPEASEPQSSRAASPGPAGERTSHHASASGTSAVAIDNKIEQAMDLVKSHLMFAVREEVEVLKERIAELMERISQLELENSYLRAHASPDTLAQLPVAPPKPAPQPSAPGPVS